MLEFQQFFDVEHTGIKDINQIVVFVWRTFYDKLVEEEITVLEEGNICGFLGYYFCLQFIGFVDGCLQTYFLVI